jgi:hypothetical protein
MRTIATVQDRTRSAPPRETMAGFLGRMRTVGDPLFGLGLDCLRDETRRKRSK